MNVCAAELLRKLRLCIVFHEVESTDVTRWKARPKMGEIAPRRLTQGKSCAMIIWQISREGVVSALRRVASQHTDPAGSGLF